MFSTWHYGSLISIDHPYTSRAFVNCMALGLIHCDLKPENILVKSYSRCEVKVIDLGSSCLETYCKSYDYQIAKVSTYL